MTASQIAPRAAWEALNDRQRAYLAPADALGREHEAAEDAAWSRGGCWRPAEARR